MSTYPYAAPGRAGFTFRQMPVLPSLQLRHRPQAMLKVTDLDELDVPALLDDLAEDLVTEDQVRGCGGATPDHVLVAAADVGGDHLEDDAVLELASDVGRVHPRTVQ